MSDLPDCCFPRPNANPAEVEYCAYLTETGGLNYQGNPCPKWEDLPEGIQSAWHAAATASSALKMPVAEVLGLCQPIQDPYERDAASVMLFDRNPGPDATPLTVKFEDVLVLQNEDGRLTLSRLGIINTLLDQVVPGLRLVAHVPKDGEEPDPAAFYGLALRRMA